MLENDLKMNRTDSEKNKAKAQASKKSKKQDPEDSESSEDMIDKFTSGFKSKFSGLFNKDESKKRQNMDDLARENENQFI